jgi:hypothetical protein
MFILKHGNSKKFSVDHQFLWTDPATQEADIRMMQEIKQLATN